MLKKEELRKTATFLDFDLWQKEKDYLQHLFLLFLSKYSKNEIVFKGGTALQKTYGLSRFSSDLDFTMIKIFDIEKTIENIVLSFGNFGFGAKSKTSEKNVSLTANLKIEGPLYDGNDKTLATIKIEISKRERIVLPPATKEITPLYPDLQPYLLYIMQEKEILAEKMRAILTRAKARDVYDLWFLFGKGVKFDENLVKEKLNYYNQKWSFSEFSKKLGMKKAVWEAELGPLVSRVPDFTDVKKGILEKIK